MKVVAAAVDPARRPDVLLRKRRPEGEQMSAWWPIGAFVVISAIVIALMNFVSHSSPAARTVASAGAVSRRSPRAVRVR
ncbi:MAG: hypothetical protein ABT08_12765 [Microbacterium sp. SCN 71-21]|nr:MAG: hypothetical protein ABT08_12765 [Microbacterium sp. SCN 71-21]